MICHANNQRNYTSHAFAREIRRAYGTAAEIRLVSLSCSMLIFGISVVRVVSYKKKIYIIFIMSTSTMSAFWSEIAHINTRYGLTEGTTGDKEGVDPLVPSSEAHFIGLCILTLAPDDTQTYIVEPRLETIQGVRPPRGYFRELHEVLQRTRAEVSTSVNALFGGSRFEDIIDQLRQLGYLSKTEKRNRSTQMKRKGHKRVNEEELPKLDDREDNSRPPKAQRACTAPNPEEIHHSGTSSFTNSSSLVSRFSAVYSPQISLWPSECALRWQFPTLNFTECKHQGILLKDFFLFAALSTAGKLLREGIHVKWGESDYFERAIYSAVTSPWFATIYKYPRELDQLDNLLQKVHTTAIERYGCTMTPWEYEDAIAEVMMGQGLAYYYSLYREDYRKT